MRPYSHPTANCLRDSINIYQPCRVFHSLLHPRRLKKCDQSVITYNYT